MSFEVKKKIRAVKTRNYLNKDFDGFRNDLLRYAKTFFPDRMQDFSENSLGGLLLELAAYVGDVNSFYLDHQFNELNVETAVETRNVERHLRAAGVEITGASPATVIETFYVEVPSEFSNGVFQPQGSALPKILQGTLLKAKNGTIFELVEDVDFAEKTSAGDLTATVTVSVSNQDGTPASYVLSQTGECVSGTAATQTFSIPNQFVPFRTLTLSKENITQIIRVVDTEGNTYYEVGSLTQDTVFRGILNRSIDDELVKENLELIPAPYRYTKNVSFQTGLTTLRFGGGQADSLDDDIVPDPSELAIPLYGKTNFSRFTIDPNSLLQTQTLGISPVNTTLTVEYRYGGGLSHNVSENTINSVTKLLLQFAGVPSTAVAAQVRASVDVVNQDKARGGENAPTLDEMRSKIPAARNAQSRIVTREDLLARVYTMPSNFGRVFRAGVRSNPNNPLATQLFIISRDSAKKLVVSPDTLKKNLRLYLNQFRLIADAIDILDAQVINFGLTFQVTTDPDANRNGVVQAIIADLKSYFDIRNFQIDQPISISDVTNIIINTPGVVSLVTLKFSNYKGVILEREYSDISFDVDSNTFKGLLVGPNGSIFELRYPDNDIIGSAF